MNFSHKRPNDFCLRDTFGGPSEVEDDEEGLEETEGDGGSENGADGGSADSGPDEMGPDAES